VPSPRAINPLISPALEAIILRALAKPREQRFQTMEEFAEALMDPERYATVVPQFAATQPIPNVPTLMSAGGVTPDGRADSVVSGRVVFGHGPADATLGAASAPMPSTFRHAQGEVLGDDELDQEPRPRRAGKIVALLGVAAAAAGSIAYYLTQQQASEATAPAPAPVAAAASPPAPKKVRLALKSDPPGATVLRKDTSEQLGVTPFDLELAPSKIAVEFLFKKESYRDKTESFVPEESGQVAVALVPVPEPPAEKPAVVPANIEPAGPAARPPAPSARRRPATARHGRSMDEDGVLAPSF
jgi:serine/threonine-protein kinase